MKPQLFIISLLSHFMLTSQENNQSSEKPRDPFEGIFWDDSYELFQNDSMTPACNTTVPGFDSLGLTIVYFIVFAFSFVGNSIVVLVVWSMKKARASTDIYLMHLAIADLLFCLSLPFWAIKNHRGWIYGNFLCKLLSGFQEASVYSGVFLLSCISVDRYCAIVRATRMLSSRRLLIKVVCIIVWIVAGVLALPTLVKKESIYAPDLDRYICYENITGESSYQFRAIIRVLRHSLGFFLPLVVMVFCYSWTVVKLFYTRNQQKHKAMRVILAVVLAFVLCWLPYNVAVVIDTLMEGGVLMEESCETRYAVQVAVHVSEVFAFMHCAVNPVLYAFIGVKFRNQLLLALYKHGVISKRIHIAYRMGSVNSTGSRKTSVSM